MRRFLYLIIYIGSVVTAHAQHVFKDVSLSEALIQLDQSSKRYDISFVYDELEDFTVTKTIKKNCSLPDAVREVCGFYPVRVIVKGRDILVECIQKDRTKLSGKLVDADRQPIAYANIILYDASDTLVIGGGVSNEAGDFVIPCRLSQAKVRISCMGFKTIERQLPVADVGTIRMQVDNKLLNNVTVSGRMPVIRNEANRLQYIVANDAYAKGLSALELLHRVPMVSIENGHATILGKGAAHYMMNGRVMEMDDEVIQQRLWSMYAEDIERIEVITMPTGKYLTDIGGGYINFVMNRDQSLGWRSDLSGQTGMSDKFCGRMDASVNYASEKFDMALDVNGNWLTKTEDKHIRHYYTYNERNITSRKETENKDLGANMMLRYQPKNNLEIGGYASYQQLWPKSDIVSMIKRLGQFNTIIFSESTMKYTGNHVLNISTYIDWTLGKPNSKLSFSYNFYKKQDDYESNVVSEKTNYSEQLTHDTYQKNIYINESSYRIHSVRVGLSEPLSTKTIMNAGVSYTNISNKANNSSFHEENILSGNISILHNFSNNIKAMMAIRYEHTKDSKEGKYDYIDYFRNDHLFPSISLDYHSDYFGRIGAVWTMSVTRPNFYDLNPLTVFDSSFDYSIGNPFLKPSYENRVEVNYTSKKGLYASIYYTHGKDQIYWMTIGSSGTSSTMPNNFFQSDKTGLYINYYHLFWNKVNLIVEGDLFYYDATQEIPIDVPFGTYAYGYYEYSGNIGRLYGWGKRYAISGDVFLNHQHSLLLNIRYDQWLNDYDGLSEYDTYGYFSFALRYSLLNDRLKLSLTAVDPFHQNVKNRMTKYLYTENYQKIHSNLHSHYIGLTATYSLGGKKVRQIHHDFSDSEQQRAIRK